jgi:hypothetical protein
VFDILEKIKSGELNIKKLAAETGISAGRIYKWKDRDSKITLEDALLLEEWSSKRLDNSIKTNSEMLDLSHERLPELTYEALTELAASVKRIEQRIDRIFPGETDTLFDVVRQAIGNKDSGRGRDKSGRHK